MKTFQPQISSRFSFSSFLVITLFVFLNINNHLNSSRVSLDCAQVAPISLSNDTLNLRYFQHLKSNEFQSKLISRFVGAIQIQTVSYDEMRGGPKGSKDQDPILHKGFLEFHEFLAKTYPLVHRHLKRHVINKFSLLFHWEGRDPNLKPAMLMAHQDVVPVDPSTASQWKFPPFSGVMDQGRIFGRGTTDTKMTLISIFESCESLLEMGFIPSRSVFLSFGHDEEISGFNGISKIVDFLQSEYKIGPNGIELIVDEGMSLSDVKSKAFQSLEVNGSPTRLALVGISEKGYMDLNITLTMKKGGHSSLPPPHTAIGILAQMITILEDNPSPLLLLQDNPILENMKCVSRHTDSLTIIQKFALDHFPTTRSMIYSWFSSEPTLKATIATTQAIDVISGGVKVLFF